MVMGRRVVVALFKIELSRSVSLFSPATVVGRRVQVVGQLSGAGLGRSLHEGVGVGLRI